MVGRRGDGYHLLDSLVVFPDIGDVLRAEDDGGVSLAIGGPFGAALAGENLVSRAARALDPKRGARLALEKNLPVASGVGGGSADAAAALRLLNRLWRLDRSDDDLARLALDLGADVPACLRSRPARMEGIGERLSPGPALPAFGIVLVNPGVPVATADVFRARAPGFSTRAALPSAWLDAAAMAQDLARLKNDLEPPARRLCSAIDEVLAWLCGLDGCLLSRMSGSGATCFGLFATVDQARRAAASPAPGWWRWGGGVT